MKDLNILKRQTTMEKKHVQEVLTYDHFISEEVAHVLENAGEVAARARELKN